jgi:hypothetical protein
MGMTLQSTGRREAMTGYLTHDANVARLEDLGRRAPARRETRGETSRQAGRFFAVRRLRLRSRSAYNAA